MDWKIGLQQEGCGEERFLMHSQRLNKSSPLRQAGTPVRPLVRDITLAKLLCFHILICKLQTMTIFLAIRLFWRLRESHLRHMQNRAEALAEGQCYLHDSLHLGKLGLRLESWLGVTEWTATDNMRCPSVFLNFLLLLLHFRIFVLSMRSQRNKRITWQAQRKSHQHFHQAWHTAPLIAQGGDMLRARSPEIVSYWRMSIEK